MMNAKKPPWKISMIMWMMNYMLYTVFLFQFFIICLYATLSTIWRKDKGENYDYLNLSKSGNSAYTWFIQLLTYWVAYSHMIPISLYVIIEVLKLILARLIKFDECMIDPETKKSADCWNSDLIEELGQVEFIFSDKTGTLTQNKMDFKKCSIGGKIFMDNEKFDLNQFDNETSEHSWVVQTAKAIG